MSKKSERLAVFAFGVVFVVVMLALAVAIPNPTPTQYETFKIVLALAAAGIAAFIPGFLEVTVPGWIRAGGALAVFVLVFTKTPANLVVDGPLSLSLGAATSNSGNAVVDFGRVLEGQTLTASLAVENLAARPRTVTVDTQSADVMAAWESNEQNVTLAAGERRNVKVTAQAAGEARGALTLREGSRTLRELGIEFEIVPRTVTQEKPSGPKMSGRGGDFSESYPLCLGPAPKQYTLIKDSIRFWLTGDRSCGNWSHCDPVSSDDADVCYSFSLQGHSEDGSARQSEGHLRADYQLRAIAPVLR